MNSNEASLLQMELSHVREGMGRQDLMLGEVLKAVNVLPVVQSQLNVMQLDMARGTGVMSDHEKRIQAVERDMPALREIRGWVVAGVLFCVTALGGAVVKLVIIDRPPAPAVTAPPVEPKPTSRGSATTGPSNETQT